MTYSNRHLKAFCLALLLFPFAGKSQKQHPLVPQSPTAAAAGKYGDIDVSLYTGQINPTIKLFKLKFNDFEFPIHLNYASSGLKVHETPSSVGIGWVLNCLYVVNRQVKNVPDEQTHGYNGLQPTATIVQSINSNNYTTTPAYPLSQTDFQRGIGQTDYDGEPDLFNVSAPSFGGKFFFDETQIGTNQKSAVFVPKQPVTVVANFNYYASGQLFNTQNNQGRIEGFIFYDGKGVKYTFNKQEGANIADDAYQFGQNIVSTWFLTEILTPNGNKLTFNYIQRTIDLPHAQSEYRFLFESGANNGGLDSSPHKTVSQSTITETVLSEILINNGTWGKVEFVENTADRADWSFSLNTTKPKSLKEILLKDGSGTIIKKYAFGYDNSIANRLLLRTLTEYGKNGTTAQEPYRFDYYNESNIPTLPYDGSGVISREDHWGYYNANATGSLLPDFQIVTSFTSGKVDTLSPKQYEKLVDSLKVVFKGFTEEQIKSSPASILGNIYYITATNRSPDFSSALIGQLQKITYPSKGSTNFVYEANSYYSNQSEEFNPCAGAYQTLATATDNAPRVEAPIITSLTVADGAFVCMKVIWNIKVYSNAQGIVEGRVSIINTDNGIEAFNKPVTGNNNASLMQSIGVEYVILPGGNYSVIADVFGENVTIGNLSSAKIEVQAIPVTPNAYVTRTSGGLRIKEVRDCPNANANANECLIKEYGYTSVADPTNSSGRIVTKGKYAYPVSYYSNGFYEASYLNSASQLPLSTTLGHYVGYNTVIVREAKLDANGVKVYKGKSVFDYRCVDESEEPDITSNNFPFWSVSRDWKRGVLEGTKIYDQADNWLKDITNSYAVKPSTLYYKNTSLKAGKSIYNLESSTLGYDPNTFLFSKYPSISGFQFNQQTVQREQFIVNNMFSSIENTTDFEYNNDIHLQPTSSQTTSSKGEILLNKFLYPHDIYSGEMESSASALRFKGRKTELVQSESYRGSTFSSASQNYFAYFGSLLLPSIQKTYIGDSPTFPYFLPATETQQLSYDSYGNLTSFKEKDGTIHSFMWGYNGQYPVVYMVNGVLADPNSLLTTTNATTITNTANTLRTTFPNAHISNYVYEQMIGLSSKTNPAQLRTSFTFDGLNQLDKVLDNNNYIQKAYGYHVATSVGDVNYVKEMMPRTASTTLLSGYQNIQSIRFYMDALGKTLQTVVENAGGDGTNDIVTNATTYNGFGLPEKKYIPFPNAGNGALAPLPSSFDGDTRPFTENILFDNSPLNRLFKVQGVGINWYNANKVTETYTEVSGGIRSYTVASDGSVTSSTYPANSLLKKTVINEQGNKTMEYTDKEGRMVQKEQELNATETAISCNIFNDIGQLSIIIQPKVYASATSFNQTSTIFLEGMFGYTYDLKGRLISKHIPGGGWTRYVYDKLNRVVFENDDKDAAESRNYYKFFKYDALGRVIQTGLIYNIGAFDREALQTAFDNHTGPLFEERVTSDGLLGYTNVSFPYDYTPVEANVMSVKYYDDTAWNTNNDYNFQLPNAYHTQQTNVKGLMTGSLVKNLVTGAWLKAILYYDYLQRPIQTFRLTNLNHIIRSDMQYSFSNELLTLRKVKTAGNTVLSTKIASYEYNHVGKMTKYKFSLNGVERTISTNQYDAVERLKSKIFSPISAVGSSQTGAWLNSTTWQGGSIPSLSNQVTINTGHTVTIPTSTNASAGSLLLKGTLQNNGALALDNLTPSASTLQILNFSWHIRNGLRGINLDNSGNVSTVNGNLFSYKLGYEEDGTYYDGNIRKQEWKSSLDNVTRSFTYSYDKDSRIKSGSYTGTGSENYSLNNVNYDLNGNILNLSRNGLKSNNTFGLVDNLTYNYNANSNKLLSVDDVSNEISSFKDVAGNDYTQFLDGSLKSDANKEIVQIDYNYLKLPQKINLTGGRWIEYQYDADGVKLKKTLSTGKVIDYEEDEIYEDGVLYQTAHDEGRIIAGIPEYDIKDHLGNLRLSFKDNGGVAQITQSNAYGVFGDDLPSLKYINTPKVNNFGFNYKEAENEFGIGYSDFKWRFADLILGRFHSIDRLSEKFSSLSCFQFASNNPIGKVELDGLEGVWHTEVDKQGNVIRHVVELNVSPVTVENWKRSENNGQKEPKNRVESSLTSYDVQSIKSDLNMMFNGSNNIGSQNSAGETVFFDFNVNEIKVGKNDATTLSNLRNAALKSGIESGEQGPPEYAKGADGNSIAPTNIIVGARPDDPYALGDNGNVVTKIKPSEVGNASTLMHETVHQFLRLPKNEEHGLGGAMANPPEGLSPANVDAILKDAFKAKQAIIIK